MDNRPYLYAIDLLQGAEKKTVRVVAHDPFRAIRYATDSNPGRFVDRVERICPVDATLLESEKPE